MIQISVAQKNPLLDLLLMRLTNFMSRIDFIQNLRVVVLKEKQNQER